MTRDEYCLHIPRVPYCVNELPGRVIRRRAEVALDYLHIGPNRDGWIAWLLYDLDEEDSYGRVEDSGLPPPTYLAINPRNGHAHAAYELAAPVSMYEGSRRKPVEFLEAVDRGYRYRLGADNAYSAPLTKNPVHRGWQTIWMAGAHRLDELNDSLTAEDRKWRPRQSAESPIGRNVSLFDAVRKLAYGDVLSFKKKGKTREDFFQWVTTASASINQGFTTPLFNSEVRAVAKSVTKFAWREFTAAKFSRLQSLRASIRWKDTVPDSKTMPWKAQGISRATYYRNKQRVS